MIKGTSKYQLIREQDINYQYTTKMGRVAAKDKFPTLNSDEVDKILTGKKSSRTKRNTETTVKILKKLREKELLKNF